jgi:hypothetical protein
LIPSSSTSTLSAFDADFLRHAFSQQFRPSLDLSAYFAATSNGNNPASSLFRPNFSPSNFLQALTSTTPLAPPPSTLITSHTNGFYSKNFFFIRFNTLIFYRNNGFINDDEILQTNEIIEY